MVALHQRRNVLAPDSGYKEVFLLADVMIIVRVVFGPFAVTLLDAEVHLPGRPLGLVAGQVVLLHVRVAAHEQLLVVSGVD